MEIKQAIHCLKNDCDEELCEECDFYHNCTHETRADAARLAVIALEKQIPKKPKHEGCYDNDGVWHEWNGINGRPYELCPNCGTNLCCEMPNDRKPKFCDDCGQALDWNK